jgi:hypothetical protein
MLGFFRKCSSGWEKPKKRQRGRANHRQAAVRVCSFGSPAETVWDRFGGTPEAV